MQLRYRIYAKEKLRQGDLGWFLGKITKYFAIPLSVLMNKPLCGPIMGGILLTYRCNLSCLFCDYRNRLAKENRQELGTREMMAIIDGFRSIGTDGLGFMGGEPLLREDLFSLIRYAAEKGMATATTTNGYFLNQRNLEGLMRSGLKMVAVSIDGPTAEMHDRIRGMQGSFDKASEAVRKIDAYRKKYNIPIILGVSTCINSQNIGLIPKMPDFIRKLGADYINFIGVETLGIHTDAQERSDVLNFKKEDTAKIDRTIDELIIFKKKFGIIDNTFASLKLMKRQFRGASLPFNCYASNTTFYVDCYGDCYPCIGYLEMGQKISNIAEHGVRQFWSSRQLQEFRRKLYKCKECYFPCQNELNLLYKII